VLRHGRLGLRVRKQAPPRAEIIGTDFRSGDCSSGRAPKAAGARATVEFIEADALRLPFAHASFDLVSCAFGFRNLANYERGLQEILRVLKPGGTVGILDLRSLPGKRSVRCIAFTSGAFSLFWGAWISGNASAYTYLPNSVSKFSVSRRAEVAIRSGGICRRPIRALDGRQS